MTNFFLYIYFRNHPHSPFWKKKYYLLSNIFYLSKSMQNFKQPMLWSIIICFDRKFVIVNFKKHSVSFLLKF